MCNVSEIPSIFVFLSFIFIFVSFMAYLSSISEKRHIKLKREALEKMTEVMKVKLNLEKE